LGSGDAVVDEGEAFVAHFVAAAAFGGGEVDEEGHFGGNRGDRRFDFLHVFCREGGGEFVGCHKWVGVMVNAAVLAVDLQFSRV
jgi:hypothetical protein